MIEVAQKVVKAAAGTMCYASGTILVLGAVGGLASGAFLLPAVFLLGGFQYFCLGTNIIKSI